jgi:hypothetical protein
LARLSSEYGVELSTDEGNISENIINSSKKNMDDIGSSFQREPSIHSFVPRREPSFNNTSIHREPSFNGGSMRRESSFISNNRNEDDANIDNYRFQSTDGGARYSGNAEFIDPYAQKITQEQMKRQQIRHVFNNLSHNNNVPMGRYDLMADREYEDKQMLLSAIEDLRDDLTQIGVDLSRIKEVDNNSSMAEIREVYDKLIYKNNSNNYSNFADELFLLGAQAAEFLFDGDKDWFGHKPDLTGWTNTVRGKLRRMRYTKTQIVRKIVDDYQIPAWLQIGLEVIPSAFTHSRHRKTAVRDSVVNNATYQNAIHDLNNIMSG